MISPRTAEHWDHILAASKDSGIDANLIASIVDVESSGNAWAMRFEPRVFASMRHMLQPGDFASSLGITEPTERVLQSSSFGLAQVMGFNARAYGFKRVLTEMFDPALNLKIACWLLKTLFQTYGDESEVISAYNQGSPMKTDGGMYLNQTYVDKVNGRLLCLRALRS
jgi:hypothetical protein